MGLNIIITNQKYDGTIFYNFLTLVPVYNAAGRHTYVVAKIYDATQPTARYRDIKLAEEVVYLTALAMRGY